MSTTTYDPYTTPAWYFASCGRDYARDSWSSMSARCWAAHDEALAMIPGPLVMC
jgi:hypothetical protein